ECARQCCACATTRLCGSKLSRQVSALQLLSRLSRRRSCGNCFLS
ncbi:hypothetical protein TGRUB_281640C, partial [Toxoplasma gondii RUB]